MAEQSIPQCGVCKKLYSREDAPQRRLRLAVEDMADKKYPEPKKPGLYVACEECRDLYLPVIAARLGKAVEDMGHHCTT